MLASLKYMRLLMPSTDRKYNPAWNQFDTFFKLNAIIAGLEAERLANYTQIRHTCWEHPDQHREQIRERQEDNRAILRALYAVGLAMHE